MAVSFSQQRKSLLASPARVQAPWIKVSIGSFTFGVFSRSKVNETSDNFYTTYNVQYPNYIQSLNVKKINGQINQYTLNIQYPVETGTDPNFFEKVFSSVSKTRKIVFSYGDSSMPSYVYKDEEAIITKVQQSFNFGNGGSMGAVIGYTISATSTSALGKLGSFTFLNSGKKKPSTEIKRVFMDKQYGLQNLFTGMNIKNFADLVDGSDAAVELNSKTNISPLDYISYLVSCMIPAGSAKDKTSKDIYILTIHDDTVYDKVYSDDASLGGPYFKVTRTSYAKSQSDAYEIDIGYNTSTIVTSFSVTNNENYSLFYDYANELFTENYTQRLNNKGEYENIYAPVMTSKNENRKTIAEDISWYTKMSMYPISATIKILGLLRPATLMQYVRLNVIFPGGKKHVSSGLYIVTQQNDEISGSGYFTTLSLTRISGDENLETS